MKYARDIIGGRQAVNGEFVWVAREYTRFCLKINVVGNGDFS